VDGARKFKPHPDCYGLVEKALGVNKDQVMFVSSNGFDVAGAKRFGFKVVWIRRGLGPGVSVDPVLPAQMYGLLHGRCVVEKIKRHCPPVRRSNAIERK
jgi:2-haloacid dehalogenase